MQRPDFGIRCPDDFVPVPDDILETTIVARFEAIVEKHPDRTAIESATCRLTFRELNNAINDLAHRVIEEVGDNESPIAFLFKNEVFAVVTLMAVAKAGRAYTGLHPANSDEQLRSFLEDSTSSLLITSAELADTAGRIVGDRARVKILYYDEIVRGSDRRNPGRRVTPESLCSISYTAGSTGRPKGVVGTHLRRAHGAQFRNNFEMVSPSDRMPLLVSVCHGLATPSLMGTLVSGATLCILDLKASTAQQALDWMVDQQITIFRGTPSIFRAIFGLAPAGLVLPRIRFVHLGGEPLTNADVELFKAHTAKNCVLINSFAASETGIICLNPVYHNTAPFDGFLPAGRPPPGTDVFVVDEDRQVVENGREGEIAVRSRYHVQGYWRQPQLTALKFQTDPHDPQIRTYYTSDRGRWRKDGTLEVLGRMDTQIKIRGFRVQLEAVDLALRGLPGIKDAAAVARPSPGREPRLIAYVAMQEGHPFSVSRLKKGLSSQLPSYAIPSVIVRLDALPRTPAGKLARLELPEPTRNRPDLETAYTAPRNNMEIEIAGIWERLLGLDGVGVEDSFFELGGDSLMVLEMTLAVEERFSRPVPQAFLKHPTIAGLSALLANETSASGDEDISVVRGHARTRPQRIEELKNRITVAKLRRLLTSGTYVGEKIDWLVDLILARHIVGMSYLQAKEWALGWSQNASVRRLLYRRRFALFSQWVASLKGCRAVPSDAFQMSMLTNMLYALPGNALRKVNRAGHSVVAYKNSPFAYWQTLGEILDALPDGQASEQFPILGTEHLMRAYEGGHGVVLLSFHGFPNAGGFIPLKRLLGLKDIPTISFLVPRRGTRYAGRHAHAPAEEASALNAKVALLGQKTLQQGGIVNFASDWSDAPGRPYQVSVAGHLRRIKAGFAELALNTGATIIPFLRHCLEDGRIQMEFETPLNPGGGDRSLQAEVLIHQYASFIERSWAAHPEAMRWYDILDHFALPLSEARR